MDGITQKVPLDEPIIVIARSGTNETKRNLNWCRLENVRAYSIHGVAIIAQRESDKIILADRLRSAADVGISAWSGIAMSDSYS